MGQEDSGLIDAGPEGGGHDVGQDQRLALGGKGLGDAVADHASGAHDEGGHGAGPCFRAGCLGLPAAARKRNACGVQTRLRFALRPRGKRNAARRGTLTEGTKGQRIVCAAGSTPRHFTAINRNREEEMTAKSNVLIACLLSGSMMGFVNPVGAETVITIKATGVSVIDLENHELPDGSVVQHYTSRSVWTSTAEGTEGQSNGVLCYGLGKVTAEGSIPAMRSATRSIPPKIPW